MCSFCFVFSWHEEPPFTKITQSKWYAEPRRRFWVYVTVTTFSAAQSLNSRNLPSI